MKLLVVDVAAGSGGALTILQDFYNYIAGNDQKNEWLFIVSTTSIQEKHNICVQTVRWVKKSWLHRLIWDIFIVPIKIIKIRPDIVISLQNLTIPFINVPQILYVHQSLPFQQVKKFSLFKQEERILAVYQHLIGRLIFRSIKKAKAVIVQTQWMKEAILRKKLKNDGSIFILKPSISGNLALKKNVKAELTKNFFYPTSAILYKNIDCIVSAIEYLQQQGYRDFTVTCTIRGNENKYAKRIAEASEHLGGALRLVGPLSYTEVCSQYEKNITLFPSYIEAFGLPLIEARIVGSLIFASDCSFSRELLSGYKNAYYFNPFNSDELAELMKKALNNELNYENIPSSIEDITNSERNWGYMLKIAERLCVKDVKN